MTATPGTGTRIPSPPALGPEREVVWPRRTMRSLDNGLQVVLVESRTIPKVTAQLMFRSGNAAAAHETAGLAEITASVVRTGTATRTSRQIEEDLRRMGGDLSCSAGTDSSVIAFAGLAEFSDGLLGLMADLARNASFPAAEFERERRQRLDELKIERATPGFLASERMRQALFGAHPYAVVSPTAAQVEGYQLGQLRQFYRAHYVPGNALLVAVGDFEAGRMLERISKIFADWQGTMSAEPDYPPSPEIRGRNVYLVHLPGTVQAQVMAGNLAITRKHPDWLALTLANSIYGGAFHSRLVMNIREQKGYTYSPRSGANALRQHGYFSVHAAVRNEVTAATLTEVLYEMDRMRSLPVGEEELTDARNYLSGVFSLGLATQDGLLGQLATVYLNGLAEDYLETYREKIRRLTAGEIMGAARKYFDSARAQMVIVGDREHIGEQAALFGGVETRDAHGNKI